MSQSPHTLRLGTRGSLLARTQSRLVADELEKRHPGLQVELVITRTTGDLITDRPLSSAGGKGLFTRELEIALLEGRIDFAVHSFKDVPVTMPLVPQEDLVIAATTQREDPRDVLIAPSARSLADLAAGARVGTSSLRRRCQILQRRPDLLVQPVRGNVDTRLRKLTDGQFDAIILAYAGLHRTGLFDDAQMALIPLDEMLPCPGQGALALQCRKADEPMIKLLRVLDDPQADACVAAERRLVAALNGDCHSPIAALAEANAKGVLTLRAAVGGRDGQPPVLRAQATGSEPLAVAEQVYQALRSQGAEQILAGGSPP